MQGYQSPVINLNFALPVPVYQEGPPVKGEYIIVKGLEPVFPVECLIQGRSYIQPHAIGKVIQVLHNNSNLVLVTISSRGNCCLFYNWAEQKPVSQLVPQVDLKKAIIKKKERTVPNPPVIPTIKKRKTKKNKKSILFCEETLNE